MLDINVELEKILVKNKIIQKTSLYETINTIKHFGRKIKKNDTIGIYGVGEDADTLLLFITRFINNLQIDYCFDQKVPSYQFKNVIKNPSVFTIDDINEKPVDYMIIASYQFKNDMKKILEEKGYTGIVLDFFAPMETYLQEHMIDYREIYELKLALEKSQGNLYIQILKRLIKGYLLIKDFINAIKYIDIYIEHGYEDIEVYKNLKRELYDLLGNIKKEIESRKYNDIIINWIDALSYMHLQDFAFLRSKAKTGITFENAYTVNPWTTETMKTILYGKYCIKDKLFLQDNFVTEDSKLLKLLNSEGYTFAYLGMNKYVKLYDENTVILPELNFKKDISSVSRQWDALSLLCREERPMCILIHTLKETHEPYICGEIKSYEKFACTEANWALKECQTQAMVSGQYMDSQLMFYDEIFGKNIIKIYMSDHGRITTSIMRESRVHVILIIDYAGVKHETIKGLFSLIDFNKIIKFCLSGKRNFKQLERDYVLVEALDYYNLSWIKMVLGNSEYNRLEALQRRGIITLKDRYCRFANGMEGYFVTEDDIHNRINDKKYESRIEELRNLCGDEFIDINQYDKFKYSKLLYEFEERQMAEYE